MYARDVESALRLAAENPYWRESDAKMVLSFWRDSGQTLSAFARQFGLSVSRLRRWRGQLPDEELPTFHPICVVPEPGMVAVPPPLPTPSGPAPAAVELVLAGDRRVEVRPGFDAETLARVIQVVEALPC